MFNNILEAITQNKNILMFFSVFVYVIALFATLSNPLFLFSLIITIVFGLIIFKTRIPIKYIIIWCLIFYFGVANTSYRIKMSDDLLNYAPQNTNITGKIISIPQGLSENKPKFFFQVNSITIDSKIKKLNKEKVLVNINAKNISQNKLENLKIYDSFKLTGRLAMPFKAGNPSQFDYGNYLKNFNTYAVFYAKDIEKLEQKPTIKELTLQKINDYREYVIKVHSQFLESPNLEILGGIVFGDDAVSPTKEIKQSFINSGLLHILAASGMNVAFIFTFFYYFMSLFKLGYKLKISLGILTVILYTLMTGLGASVVRASCMLIFVLIGKLLNRDAHSISLLSFVALLMLIYNPMYINDVGFQLSFVVTFGILITSDIIVRYKNKILNSIIGTIAIPIIAQLWVIPIQIFYFNNISLYSIVANIMSVPILMVISFGGFVSALLAAIVPLASLICQVFDFVLNPLLTLLVGISNFWGSLPYSSLQTSHPNVFQIILYYAILMCAIGFFKKDLSEKTRKNLKTAFLIMFIIFLILLIPIKNKNLEITAFDVGNADCFLIKTPDNKFIMIDTAKSGYQGGKSQADIIVIKYLKDIGIKEIENIIITHFDSDHCGGAVDLMKNLKVKNIYVNELHHNSFLAKEIYKTAKANGVNIIEATNEEIYNQNGLKLRNFSDKSMKEDNDKSIITLLEYEDFKMLFTGDCGEKILEKFLKNFPKNITILKVPHHGAMNVLNQEIINYLNPKFALISVGENKFGHPNIYTMYLLKNSQILRTDINNSIKISINKKGNKIYAYDMKQRKYLNILKKRKN